jgi:hypothetical protein
MRRRRSYGFSDGPEHKATWRHSFVRFYFSFLVSFWSRCFFVLQENSGLVVPWIIGFITFMALEAVAMVYSNVLRDHVNRVRAQGRWYSIYFVRVPPQMSFLFSFVLPKFWVYTSSFAQSTSNNNAVARVRELTMLNERSLLVGEVSANVCRWRCHVVSVTELYDRNLCFLDRSRYYFFLVAPQLYSRGWVGPVPDPQLLRKSSSVGNRTRTSGSVARNSGH